MRKTKLVLFLGLLTAGVANAQWHTGIRITDTELASTTSESGARCIVVCDENIHIVWHDVTFPSSPVRYGRFPPGEPLLFDAGIAISNGTGNAPAISACGENVHIDWFYNSLHLREIEGSTINSIQDHGWGNNEDSYPALVDDTAGTTHCIFNSYDDTRGHFLAYQNRNADGVFSEPIEIDAPPDEEFMLKPFYPCITVDQIGQLHAAWINPWERRITYGTSPDGSNWTITDVPHTFCNYQQAPSISCNQWGAVFIAYVNQEDQIFATYKEGEVWDTVSVSAASDKTCGGPSICCDAWGTPWIAWHGWAVYNPEVNEIFYKRGLNPWVIRKQFTSLDNYPSQYPDLALDSVGDIHLIWSDSMLGNYELYYNWRLTDGQEGRDLAVTSILMPDGLITTDETSPRARIANFGERLDSCFGECEITGPGSFYKKNSVLDKYTIGSGRDTTLAFPPWDPPGSAGNAYEVKVTVYLISYSGGHTNDDNPENNVYVDTCIIMGPAVTATTILVPEQDQVVDIMSPSAYFTNTGTEPVANFYCHCDIPGSSFHSQDYADSLLVIDSMAVGDSVPAEFSQWIADDDAEYTATFHATSATPDSIYSPHMEIGFSGAITGIAEEPVLTTVELVGSNPLKGAARIAYSVSTPDRVDIKIYDVAGKLVRTVHSGELSGTGSLIWEGSDDYGYRLPEGVYFLQIETSRFERIEKLVFLH